MPIRRIKSLFIALLFFYALGCCQAGPVKCQALPRTDIEIDLGEEVVISMVSNPSTGFSWQLTKAPDGKVLAFKESQYIPGPKAILGSAGEEAWSFITLAKGKADIIFKYCRPWEKDTPPVKMLRFKIIVK